MDRLLEESFVRPSSWVFDVEGRGTAALDMYQTANDVVVKASLPGLKPEEVDISISGDTLTLKGEHKEENEAKEEDYFYRELRHGSFCRTVTIPVAVKSEKAEATFENGVLTLKMPKAEEAKRKQIKIRARPMIEASSK